MYPYSIECLLELMGAVEEVYPEATLEWSSTSADVYDSDHPTIEVIYRLSGLHYFNIDYRPSRLCGGNDIRFFRCQYNKLNETEGLGRGHTFWRDECATLADIRSIRERHPE